MNDVKYWDDTLRTVALLGLLAGAAVFLIEDGGSAGL